MIIDVDIGISNDEGRPLKRFHKHFDERFDKSSCIENNRIQNDFEDFLNKYLSVSGRTMRNQLICEENTELYTDYLYDSISSELSSNGFSDDSGNDELEYVIRIGEGKSIAGKIPLNHILKVKNLTEKIDKMQEKQVSKETSSINHFINRNRYHQKQQPTEQINAMFRTLISKAVECYEMNFYHETEEQDYITSS
jgi:hypothetical protein